jgi:hypothetical protein
MLFAANTSSFCLVRLSKDLSTLCALTCHLLALGLVNSLTYCVVLDFWLLAVIGTRLASRPSSRFCKLSNYFVLRVRKVIGALVAPKNIFICPRPAPEFRQVQAVCSFAPLHSNEPLIVEESFLSD